MIDDDVSLRSHSHKYAIIGNQSQPLTCDNRDCDIRKMGRHGRMAEIKAVQEDAIEVLKRVDRLGVSQRDLAGKIGVAENKISKIRSGTRRIGAQEYRLAMQFLDEVELKGGHLPDVSQLGPEPDRDYLPIHVLQPSTGASGPDADRKIALFPRGLIEDELRAKPSDLMLIEARGESMAPDFLHGDQILVDLRDRNPVQPGPFAVRDQDGHVVKLVERVAQETKRYRVFHANERYSSYEVDEDDLIIIGRPVWVGRRL